MAVPWRTNNSFYRKYLYNYVLLYKNRADIKMFLEIILSLVTIIIFGLFAIRPTFVTIATLLTEIKTKEDISLQLDQKISNISDAQELADRYQPNIDMLHTAIPSNPTPHTYIQQIEGLVNKNAVTLEQMRMENITLIGNTVDNQIVPLEEEVLNTAVLPPSAGSVEITIDISGSYSSLLDFLKDLQNSRRPFVIDSFSIGSITESGQERIVLNLTGRLPYLNLPNTPAL